METTPSTGEMTSTTHRRDSGTARHPTVPPGVVIPLGAGPFIGVGAILTPTTGGGERQ
ncbi:hypothetical protein ABZT06_03495 [Streptomyces sp. NPDC005483]|uniref:hypothetical protein n=1 Tax=Streptomyces sp. NPDC005483 TaxID=3154882 RepID=UPI0033AB5AE7